MARKKKIDPVPMPEGMLAENEVEALMHKKVVRQLAMIREQEDLFDATAVEIRTFGTAMGLQFEWSHSWQTETVTIDGRPERVPVSREHFLSRFAKVALRINLRNRSQSTSRGPVFYRVLHTKVEADTVTDSAGIVSLTGGVQLWIDKGREGVSGEQWFGPVTMLDLMHAAQANMLAEYRRAMHVAAGV